MFVFTEITTNENECDLIQYLTIGSNGTIQCSFSEYHAVSWYYPEKDKPILFYEEGDKRGDGYVSGDYDVYPNGSLYIRNVTLQQETLFRVTKVISLSEPTISYLIRVQTISKYTDNISMKFKYRYNHRTFSEWLSYTYKYVSVELFS